jgi:diacylglycerol kinase
MIHNKSLPDAFRNAFNGLAYVFKSQRNAKIHFCATILVIAAGFFLHISTFEWIAVLFAIGLVLASECFNTALEKLTDLVTSDYHELARLSKDSSAAAVLVSSLIAAVIGLIVFLPRVILLFGNI